MPTTLGLFAGWSRDVVWRRLKTLGYAVGTSSTLNRCSLINTQPHAGWVPSTVTEPAQLGNFLAQLPAALVEKVEVISNPSARDNHEGSSGIINIVLKKKVDAGSSGGLTLAQGTTGRTDVGGNVGYQRGLSTWRPHHLRQLRPAE